jgi:streptogramin lyase
MRMLVVTILAAALASGATSRDVVKIPTGGAPCGATAAFGSMWIANDGAGTLVRLDPATNRIVRRVRVGSGACSVAAGAGAVWVTNYKRSTVVRVDPRRRKTRAVHVDAAPFDVLVAFGRVWVTAWEAGTVDEIDPATLRIVRRLPVGDRPAGLTSSGGALWVGFGRDATAVARVEPRTGAIERIDVGARAPAWFATGTADLWIQANDGDLVHLDPASRKVRALLHVGRTIGHGAAAQNGALWMPDKEQDLVYVIDPEAERVVNSFGAGNGAFEAVAAFESMWVTSYAGSDVWRFKAG